MGSKNNYRLDLIKILFYLLGLPSGLDDSGRLCLSFVYLKQCLINQFWFVGTLQYAKARVGTFEFSTYLFQVKIWF